MVVRRLYVLVLLFGWLVFHSRDFTLHAQSADQRAVIEPRERPASPINLAKTVLSVDSSLVLIPVHVTTALGVPVTGLQKINFYLCEDGAEQVIKSFTSEDGPISVGLVLDTSASMKNKTDRVSAATEAFFGTANPADEFFLVEFNGRARLAVPFTKDPNQLNSYVRRSRPSGNTSLFDAIHLALGVMKQNARYSRRALVILSDGGDNWSRRNFREIKRELTESDVQVYAMGIFDRDYNSHHPREERNGPAVLEDLTAQTGGRDFPVARLEDLPAIATEISRDLRQQYILGYYSTNPVADGKYRRVTVQLTMPEQIPPLRTDYRRGYFVPNR